MTCGVTEYPNVNDHEGMKELWILS